VAVAWNLVQCRVRPSTFRPGVFFLTLPLLAAQSLAESVSSARIAIFTSNGHTPRPPVYKYALLSARTVTNPPAGAPW